MSLKRICVVVLVVVVGATAHLQAQSAQEGAVTLIDNDRVLIRVVTWAQGQPAPTFAGGHPFVIVSLADGAVDVRDQSSNRIEVPVSEASPRAVLVELKSATPSGSAAAPGYPSSFPRSGARQLMDRSLVNVWNVTWPKDQPTVMHTHPYPTVSVTLAGGRQRETRLDGTSSDRDVEVGEVRFSEAGRVHQEEGLSDPARRAVIIELK